MIDKTLKDTQEKIRYQSLLKSVEQESDWFRHVRWSIVNPKPKPKLNPRPRPRPRLRLRLRPRPGPRPRPKKTRPRTRQITGTRQKTRARQRTSQRTRTRPRDSRPLPMTPIPTNDRPIVHIVYADISSSMFPSHSFMFELNVPCLRG